MVLTYEGVKKQTTSLSSIEDKKQEGKSVNSFYTLHYILMDDISMENWQKVKDAMEASGNTDNFYYKRACAVLAGEKDPINAILNPKEG